MAAVKISRLGVACFFLGALSVSGVEAKQVQVVPDGPEKTLFKWDERRCEPSLLPDAPARAFRRADDRITLLAAHFDNWSLTGDSFETLSPSCTPVMRSSDYAARGMGSMWIEATYTRDGRAITGLASQDLTTQMKQAGCEVRGLPGRCWLNNIVAVQSNDMGETFELLPEGKEVVAALGDAYRSDLTERYGYFTTSNIVGRNEAYYVFMFAQGEHMQPKGNCLFRTADPFDPLSWKGWDGTGFTVVPRLEKGAFVACRPVAPHILSHEVRSVNYITSAGVWVAVFADRRKLPSDDMPVPGFYVSTSSDLLNWTTPSRIKPSPTRPRVDSDDILTSYPSIIDPGSRSRNFDTIDSSNPVLLYTVQHLKNGQGTMNRDLVYVPLRIDVKAD
jgi:hypothetical protein